jgi:benzoyl-CoA reductase/2-hydroxyglutaryl-CoA dehydratase subunit BcrC/BadD/HgdB
MRNYAGRLIEAMQGKYPICWYNLGFNPEILYAMDIAGVCIQQLGAFYSITQDLKSVIDLIDYAEALGIPSDTCSADKLSTAVITQKLYPRPVCHVAINAPCDSQVLASQKMLELEPAPFFVIDIPYYKDKRSIQYVANQLGELIPFLSQHTGQKFDWDRLRKVCEISNRIVENMWEWMEWRKHVPVVQPSKLSPKMVLYGQRASRERQRKKRNGGGR